MVEKIASLKDEILMQAEQDMHEGGRVNPESIDAVKDLAEAEKACWEAEYYRSVTEAMEDGQMGYDGGMGGGSQNRGNSGYGRNDGGRGYREGGRGYRRGYRGQPRDSQGQYTSRRGYRRGYGHQDMMQEIRQMMETADPKEREELARQMREMLGM